MQDAFITKIHIEKVRHLQNIDIVLSNTERVHLIFTGKNGSGKTSLLEAMKICILNAQYNGSRITSNKVDNYNIWNNQHKQIEEGKNSGVNITYSPDNINLYEIVFAYIPVFRSKFTAPKVIEQVFIEGKNYVTRNASKDFLKYILNLDYQLYGAKNDKNKILEKNLDKWFLNFQSALREVYNCEELELRRDAKNLRFIVEMPEREPFSLHEMADGYAACLDIYMELLMRFENEHSEVDYDTPAIVLIDEIETHLHVELQKRILPFLTKMFPNVQFIAATHSPFVINSLDNAVIFDLEKKTRLENPSFYSYETILESFLDTDMYSSKLKAYFERYKELCFKERTPEENDEFLRAKSELEMKALPSKELYIAFQEIAKVRKAEKNGTSE